MIKGYKNIFFPGSELILCYIKKPQTTQREVHGSNDTSGVRLLSEVAVMNPTVIVGIHLSIVK